MAAGIKKIFLKTHPLIFCLFLILLIGLLVYVYSQYLSLNLKNNQITAEKNAISRERDQLKAQDQIKVNQQLKEEINNLKNVFQKSLTVYENLVDARLLVKNMAPLDSLFTQSLNWLSKTNYASASATLDILNQKIAEEKQKSVPQPTISSNIPQNNTPPGSGYQRQKVMVDGIGFTVDIVAADLGSTKVVVDTASDSTCANNCPVKSLSEYVSRSGAFAGINGSYFCPETYPQCAEKKNSFDTLLMNKNKVYFNSDNNVYSTLPVAIFYGTTYRFIPQSLEWGRDTSVDAVIANQPLLILNSQIYFNGDGDPKHNNKGGRSFIGASGNTVYIGVVHNATVVESAKVLKTLGLNAALNLDNGGSTALWFGGYKTGPGRNIPNAVLLIKK